MQTTSSLLIPDITRLDRFPDSATGSPRDAFKPPLAFALAPDRLRASRRLFDDSFNRVRASCGGALSVPSELVFVVGPPGAGKGTLLEHIRRLHGGARSVTCSDALRQHEPARRLIDAGALVPDTLVVDGIFSSVFDAAAAAAAGGTAVVLDGFPRTALQVDVIAHLHSALQRLPAVTAGGRRRRPAFSVVLLDVDEQTSVARQLSRAVAVEAHNRRVCALGVGTPKEVRATDCCPQKARRRYDEYRRHCDALEGLRAIAAFHVIDASASPEDCRQQLERKLAGRGAPY